MRRIASDPPPAEFEALLERRRQWGADRHDEIWEGVPDRGLHRPEITGDWRPMAALGRATRGTDPGHVHRGWVV